MKNKLSLVTIFGLIYLILGITFYYNKQDSYYFSISTQTNKKISKNIDIKTIANLNYLQYNHASSVTTSGDTLFVTWYSGDEETAPNTNIMLATAKQIDGHWQFSKTRSVMNRQEFQSIFKKHIHHLGNPIIYAQSKKVWLIFTSSTGGWVTSSLNIMYSTDLGKTWSTPKMIISSPIMNFSTLTRGSAIKLDNGNFAVPVYKEFNNLNGRWFIFNNHGQLIDVSEMTNDGVNLQPTVVPLSKTHALAFYRQMYSSIKKIYTNQTSNSGQTWTTVKPTELNNPDSGIAAIKTKNGILLAYNDASHGRSNLSLAYRSDSSKSWQNIYTFPNKAKGELSYPAFTFYKDSIILSFSDKLKKTIRVVEIKGEETNA
ncbi:MULTISPECIES: sialidase family protein [unclassified Francisella]|uniref:sialidase family protein n=1 Tax=unclassified Francisella TaxID=2610885 RepID=UPI002E3354FD|nr:MULTISPECIES: sialidase family protein [unclassified Francisella]MED7819513.1 sialidase family protein [Francisella sp. 19S2-4]MED7830302.1 sialidase family protein [Francisella sp. 19S2-10]